MLDERLGGGIGEATLYPFLVIGLATVAYWHFTEKAGCGDLRAYLFVQFFPLIALPVMFAMTAPKYNTASVQYQCFAWYAGAKVLELGDKRVYKLTNHFASGHTLKHVTASFGPLLLLKSLSTIEKA
jgi:hypothetical protein